jgi:cell pole-organizing protein PopZ
MTARLNRLAERINVDADRMSLERVAARLRSVAANATTAGVKARLNAQAEEHEGAPASLPNWMWQTKPGAALAALP